MIINVDVGNEIDISEYKFNLAIWDISLEVVYVNSSTAEVAGQI